MTEFFNSFHIYNDNKPEWNYHLDNFESQSPETQLYYAFEFLKMRRGISWGTVKIHPWLYYHCNYFTIPIDIQNEDGVQVDTEYHIAPLRDNEWLINEHLIQAEKERKGLCIYGSRRLAKSVFEASFTSYNATIRGGGEARPCVVYGENSADLKNITDYINVGMKRMHPMFNLFPPTTTDYNSEKGVLFGYKDKQNVGSIHANIIVNNLGGGSQKGAGQTPMSSIFDEIGKYDIVHHFNVTKIALNTPYGWRVVPLLAGTGGDIKLSQPSQSIFTNPHLHGLVPMKWNLLNNKCSEPTWNSGQTCGLFMPGQFSLEFPKIKTSLSKYLNVNIPYLDKVEILETDFTRATKKLKSDLEEAKRKDAKTYLNLKTHLPLDVLDCFLASGNSPFCVAEALDQKIMLESKGITDFNFEVSLSSDGRLNLIPSNPEKVQAEYPFPGGNIDCPVQIFIAPPKNPSFDDNLFVGGLDDYKQDKSNTDSLGAFYIVRRTKGLFDKLSYKIACSLVTRPVEHTKFHETIRMLQIGYGARTLQEGADLGYEKFLELKHRSQLPQLLVDGRPVAAPTKGKTLKQKNTRYGLATNTKNKALVIGAVVNYANENVEQYDKENNIFSERRGVYRIEDIGLLNEIISYMEGNNFDRIIAFGHALLWAQYLDSKFVPTKESEEENNTKKKPESRESIELKKARLRHRLRQKNVAYGRKDIRG